MRKIIFLLLISVSSQAQTLMGFNSFMGSLPTATNLTSASFPILQGGASKMAPVSLLGSVFTVNAPLSLSGNTFSLTYPLPIIYGGTGTTTPGLNAGTNITITGTWPNQTINSTAGGGGITNSAANNELMKSNGTNAVSSGLFSSASGDLDFGTTSLTGNRTINAQSSSTGSALIVKGNYVTGGNIEFLRITSNGNTGGGAIETPSNAWLAINSNTSNTNSVNPALFLISQPSGTPTTGHGISLNLESTNVGGQYSKAASIQAVYTDVTASSQNADLVVKLANNSTTVSEAFRILSSGAIAVGGSTNYGTSGQVLTSQGSGSAPIWSSSGLISGLTSSKIPYATGSASLSDSEISRGGSGNYQLVSSNSGGQVVFLANNTSTTANSSSEFDLVAGSATSEIRLYNQNSTVPNLLYFIPPTGGLTVSNYGNSAPPPVNSSGLIFASVFTNTSAGNTVDYPVLLGKMTSLTPAIGIGTGMIFETQTGSSTYKNGSTIESVSTSVTASSEAFDLVFKNMSAGAGAAERLRITALGNIYGTSGTTSMTDGFFYIPSGSGAPSGTPTSISGRVPMYYDATNNNFYIYNGAWKKVALL